MDELKLNIEEVKYDETLANKNIDENIHLFHNTTPADGVGVPIAISESEVEY